MFEAPGEPPQRLFGTLVESQLNVLLPWAERPIQNFEVSSEALVSTLLRKAIDHWRLKPLLSYDTPLVHGLVMADQVTGRPVKVEALVRPDGSAVWWFNPETIAVRHLVDASRAKVCAGDPTKLFLIMDEAPQRGGNGIDYWFQALRFLQESGPYIESLAAAYGGYSAFKEIQVNAGKSIKKYRNLWSVTGGDLRHFRKLFDAPRSTPEAAKLISMDKGMTPAMLEFLGLAQRSDGLWYGSDDPSLSALGELAQIVSLAGHRSLGSTHLRGALAEILELPVGERAALADQILARHQLTHNRDSSYLLAVREIDPDTYDVLIKNELVAVIRPSSIEGEYIVLTSMGSVLLGDDKTPITFATIDLAAQHAASTLH